MDGIVLYYRQTTYKFYDKLFWFLCVLCCLANIQHSPFLYVICYIFDFRYCGFRNVGGLCFSAIPSSFELSSIFSWSALTSYSLCSILFRECTTCACAIVHHLPVRVHVCFVRIYSYHFMFIPVDFFEKTF